MPTNKERWEQQFNAPMRTADMNRFQLYSKPAATPSRGNEVPYNNPTASMHVNPLAQVYKEMQSMTPEQLNNLGAFVQQLINEQMRMQSPRMWY